ncbi:MAG: flagellar M-ring protein FliF, partial [Chlorobiales bacterium]|nr:flagellar M-ring protein FliF [Chlorobiales bacterium]
SIFVPAEQADELRIEMAGLDLQVTQLKGLERLEEVGMGDTEKTIAAKKQLALQEEIQKSLNSLNAVESSQVNLALPPDTGFITREEIPAKASIILKLKGSRKLSPEQIRGIQVLVAYSVQGLNEDNVIIVDQHSNPLSQSGDDNALFNMASMNEEKRIIQNVRKLLEPTFGTNRFTVAANVELNRESRREKRTQIDTNSPAEVSFESSEEEEEGGTAGGGVPGAESNTGDPNASPASGSQTSRSRTTERRQTEYPTTEIETMMAPGDIKRKSVSVVIDLQETTTQDQNGQEVTQYVSWGADKLNSWEEALKKAAGIDDTPADQGGRGDSLTLTEISFDNLHQVTEQIREEQRTQVQRRMFDIFEWSDWTALIKIPLLITIIFVIFWFVIRPIGKVVLEPIMALPSRAAAQIPEELPKTVEE